MPMEARASIQPASSIAFFTKEHQTSLLTMLVSHTVLCIMEEIACKLLHFIFGVADVLCIVEQIASKLLHFIFGVVELNLRRVGGVDSVE